MARARLYRGPDMRTAEGRAGLRRRLRIRDARERAELERSGYVTHITHGTGQSR